MYCFAEDVTITWGGRVITGIPDDGKVVVSHSEDRVSQKTGIQGDSMFSKNANQSGTVKVPLFCSSASIAELRSDAQKGVQKTLVVRNANKDGGFIVNAENCAIQKVPDATLGKDEENTEVVFLVPKLVYS